MTQLQIFWTVYVSLCVFYAAYVWRLRERRRRVLEHGVVTRVKVVELDFVRGEDGPDLVSPIVAFAAPNGQRYKVKLLGSCEANKYRVGQLIAIRYDPARPAEAILAEARWTVVWVHAVLCGCLIAFGMFLYVKVEIERARLRDAAATEKKSG